MDIGVCSERREQLEEHPERWRFGRERTEDRSVDEMRDLSGAAGRRN